MWLKKGAYDKAVADYTEAIRLNPKHSDAYNNRGVAFARLHDYGRAFANYSEVIRLEPESFWGYNNRAWLLATCPEDKYRDGKKAIEAATRACELSEWKAPQFITTLAAAYAEDGDFAKAVGYQEKANKLYGNTDDKKKGELMLKLFRENKPFREEPGH